MKKIIIMILTLLTLYSCEDPVPTDYVPQNYLEAALLVGQPIDDIILMRTQPINAVFDYESSLIRDAEVIITGDDKEFKLQIDATGIRGYYSNDDYRIKGNTRYNIEVIMSDGSRITGTTLTPDKVEWVRDLPENIQYPKDTIRKISNDTLIWEGIPTPIEEGVIKSNGYWGVSVKCLDSLEYGLYLDSVPNSEKNRRLYNAFSNPDNQWRYKELAQWGIIPNKKTPVVWNFFKWYGLHEIAIYNMDNNYIKWFFQRVVQSEFDPNLSTVKGDGIGVFGSLNGIRDTFFLVKNQP
ncbi:MAG: DUF4249 family protein [Ignavibacteriae bacterium]|nr:DUF4249 family protein [Ignavibacteriota bacterium]MCB9220327.1 DUF4249 family protein [Ignavibacteria bacterium]